MKSYPSKLKQVNEKIGIGKILSMHERHANQRCGVNLAIKGPVLSLLLFSSIQEKKLNSNHSPITKEKTCLQSSVKKRPSKADLTKKKERQEENLLPGREILFLSLSRTFVLD